MKHILLIVSVVLMFADCFAQNLRKDKTAVIYNHNSKLSRGNKSFLTLCCKTTLPRHWTRTATCGLHNLLWSSRRQCLNLQS